MVTITVLISTCFAEVQGQVGAEVRDSDGVEGVLQLDPHLVHVEHAQADTPKQNQGQVPPIPNQALRLGLPNIDIPDEVPPGEDEPEHQQVGVNNHCLMSLNKLTQGISNERMKYSKGRLRTVKAVPKESNIFSSKVGGLERRDSP